MPRAKRRKIVDLLAPPTAKELKLTQRVREAILPENPRVANSATIVRVMRAYEAAKRIDFPEEERVGDEAGWEWLDVPQYIAEHMKARWPQELRGVSLNSIGRISHMVDALKRASYDFSRKEIARHKCLDCGVNVIEVGDYCLVHPNIWDKQLHLQWEDNMCIACIEKRLGRKLTMADFVNFPSVEGYGMSAILWDRRGMDKIIAGIERQKERERCNAKRRAKYRAERERETQGG